jgi:hypothetical protein
LSDDILLNISELCPRLNTLNIQNSTKITDVFFERVATLGELRVLELQGYLSFSNKSKEAN